MDSVIFFENSVILVNIYMYFGICFYEGLGYYDIVKDINVIFVVIKYFEGKIKIFLVFV